MTSPFAEVGPKLFALGYSPIPIKPGSKVPGQLLTGGWELFKGWNKFCNEQPVPSLLNVWSGWPDAGVGVACGRGLVVIDVDCEEALDAIMRVLPPTPVAKVGRKGRSFFYRGDTAKIRSRNYRTADKVGLLDLLAEGKQTVLPPTVHPDTGEPYYWVTDFTLDETPLAELGELPDDIADVLADVLRPFGYEAAEPIAALPPLDVPDVSHVDASGFYRQLNSDALANIGAWAPDLGLPKGRFHGRVYRAVSAWRPSGSGRPMGQRSPNLSISPGGIEDFGTGEKFTAIDVVLRSLELGQGQLSEAVVWLGERLGYNFAPEIVLTKKAAQKPVERPERREASLPAVGDQARCAPPEPREAAIPGEPPGRGVPSGLSDVETLPEPASAAEMDELCRAPGIVGKIVEWIVGTSTSPCRPLALGPTLAFIGALAGRHQAGPTDTRTNLYVLGLASSGYGKDHGRKSISRLAEAANLGEFIGPDGFASDSAIRTTLLQRPSLCCLIDEFGGFAGKIMDKRAGSHQSSIRQMLLGLYSASNDVYRGQASAAMQAEPIFNPCLSIYGVSTPEDFWESMQGRGLGDGFLPRWLIFNVPGTPPPPRDPVLDPDPPHTLIEDVRSIAQLVKGIGNLAGKTVQVGPVRARVAPFDASGKAAYQHWRGVFQDKVNATSGDVSKLWSRCVENALRIAHIVAIGIEPEYPVLTGELIDWAIAVTYQSAVSCIAEVQFRSAKNDKQAEYLKVKRIVKEAGAAGVSLVALKRTLNGEIDRRRLDEVVAQLREAGQADMQHMSGPGGGRPTMRLVYLP